MVSAEIKQYGIVTIHKNRLHQYPEYTHSDNNLSAVIFISIITIAVK